MQKLVWMAALMIALTGSVAAGLQDPTRPPGNFGGGSSGGHASAGQPSSLLLQQVLVQGDTSLVVINGQTLQQGQKIRGYTVGAISTNQVELVSGEQSVKLTLFKAIKQASK